VKPTYDNILQYVLVALLIGILIAVANYLLGFSKEQRQRRREAKLAFRAVFENDLNSVLKSGGDARTVLSGQERKYEVAMEAYRKHLQFWQRRGFDRAWYEFYYHPENRSIPFLEQYMDFGSVTKRKLCHAELRSRISALLAYADVRP